MDIDGCDNRNPVAAVEYVHDIYAYYRKMEVTSTLFLTNNKSVFHHSFHFLNVNLVDHEEHPFLPKQGE